MPVDRTQLKILIDWSNNGSFADTGEDVSTRWMSDAQISCERGKDQVRLLSPPAAGQMNFELDNRSRDYSPENNLSPLFGLIEPGRKVQLLISDTVVGEAITTELGAIITTELLETLFTVAMGDQPLWTGLLDDITQKPGFEDLSVGLPSLGNLSRLRGKRISTALYESISTSTALGHILDAAGWPATERAISPGDRFLVFWWLEDRDAFDAAVELLYTEGPGAAIYEDGRGYFVFENRDYRTMNSRSTTSQFTFRDTDYIEDLEYEPRYKDVVNRCRVSVNQRPLGVPLPTEPIWQADGNLILGPNVSREIVITTSDPFTGAVVPDPNAGQNEKQRVSLTGSSLTGGITLSFEGAGVFVGVNTTTANIKTRLEGLFTIGAGNVDVTGGPVLANQPNGVTVEFKGTLGKIDVPLLQGQNQMSGTDPGIVIQEIQKGTPPDYIVVSGSVASMSLDRTSGVRLILTVTAGPAGVTLAGLQVRAQLIPVVAEFVISETVDTSASIAKYGVREFDLPVWPEITVADAEELANSIVTHSQEPRALVWFEVEEGDPTIYGQQTSREISDRITVVESQTGLNTDAFIERIRHVIDSAAILHTQFGCEEA